MSNIRLNIKKLEDSIKLAEETLHLRLIAPVLDDPIDRHNQNIRIQEARERIQLLKDRLYHRRVELDVEQLGYETDNYLVKVY